MPRSTCVHAARSAAGRRSWPVARVRLSELWSPAWRDPRPCSGLSSRSSAPALPRSSRTGRRAPDESPPDNGSSGGPLGPLQAWCSRRSIQSGAGGLGDTKARAALALDANARRPAFVIQEHHVGDVDRALALDDAAELALRSGGGRATRAPLRPTGALHHVQALDVQALLRGLHPQHAAALAAILAGADLHLVAGADLRRAALGDDGAAHHSTSGASETIFMKLRSRSSRATGPNTRVPRGLFWSSMITAAFSSNDM